MKPNYNHLDNELEKPRKLAGLVGKLAVGILGGVLAFSSTGCEYSYTYADPQTINTTGTVNIYHIEIEHIF